MAGNFFAGTCIFGYAKLCLFPAKRTETDTKDICSLLKRPGLVQSLPQIGEGLLLMELNPPAANVPDLWDQPAVSRKRQHYL